MIADQNPASNDMWFRETSDVAQFGFRRAGGSIHTSQTILASNATLLIAAMGTEPAAWDREAIRRKIVEDNLFGKRTESARLGSLRDMIALYGFDAPPPVTQAALAVWNTASNRSLLLGMLAVARDPILRASAQVIFAAESGESISFRTMAANLELEYPGRFSAGTLRAVGERCVSSWGQTGHLTNDTQRRRTAAIPDPALTGFAAFLAICAGFSGAAILESSWFRMLDVSSEQALSLLRRAEATGDIRLRIAGHVFDIDLAGNLASIVAAGERTHGLF